MIDLRFGDCIQTMKELSDKSIDATITSPPYDNLRTYDGIINQWNETVWKEALNQLYRITKEGGVVVWIADDITFEGSESGTSFRQALYAKEMGFRLHDTMIWHKHGGGYVSHANRYIQTFEYMFVFSKGRPKTVNIINDRKNKYGGGTASGCIRNNDGIMQKKPHRKVIKEYGSRYNIWEVSTVHSNTERTGHPAQFPVELAKDHILTWSNEGDTILDPFMGSGTIAVACIRTKRNFIGIELNEDYYNIAKDRIVKEMEGKL